MKTYTIAELDKIFKEDTYPYVALYSDTNKVLIHYPSPALVTKGEGWGRIKKRLQSTGLQDGHYMVKGKSSQDKRITPDVFYFQKGNVEKKVLDPVPLSEPAKEPEKVLTYDAAIKSNKDIADLTAEVTSLKAELALAKKDLSECEEELADCEKEMAELSDKGGLSEGKAYLEELVTTAVPIFDRYFDIQDKKLAIQAHQMNGGLPAGAPAQPPPAQAQQPQQPVCQKGTYTEEEVKEFWDKMQDLLEKNPEEYQRQMRQMQEEQIGNG